MKKKLWHLVFFIVCEALFIPIFTIFLVYYGPFDNVRNTVVTTVMGTSSNHYLANWFLSNDTINKIMQKSKPDIENAKEDVSKIVVSSKHNNGIKIINIKEKNFRANLIEVKDPGRITVGLTPNLGHSGATLKKIVQNSKAIGGINAGGFVDDNLMGTGGFPIGIIIKDHKFLYTQKNVHTFNIIGFNDNNVLVISNGMGLDEIKKSKLRCAVSFGPALIISGKPLVTYGGTTLQPRSAIAQKKDGTVMLLAIDGRQMASKGANFMELQNVLLKYGAYNAANLDGGSSTTMIYQEKTINNPCDIFGERSIPSGFLITP